MNYAPDGDFDRSESHCRRCEACRNKRDAYFKYYNIKKDKSKIKESNTSHEDDLSEEEKDTFEQDQFNSYSHNCKNFPDLEAKLNQTFGKCIEDKLNSSPRKTNNTYSKSRPEAEKWKIEYNPKLSKKSRDLKSIGRSSSNHSPSPIDSNNPKIANLNDRSITQSPQVPVLTK